MRRREDVETPYVHFDLNKTRMPSVEWLTIPLFFFFFLQGGNKYRNRHDQRKKDWCAKEKQSKDKKSSKIHPASVLVRMFWGRFRTRSDSTGHARAFSFQIWLDRACKSEALDSSGRVARPGQIETSTRHVPGPVTGTWLVSFRTFSQPPYWDLVTSSDFVLKPGVDLLAGGRKLSEKILIRSLANPNLIYVYSQTCELRPPKGLGISGPISQVVSFARLGSKIFNIESYTCPRTSHRHQRSVLRR